MKEQLAPKIINLDVSVNIQINRQYLFTVKTTLYVPSCLESSNRCSWIQKKIWCDRKVTKLPKKITNDENS